MEPGVKRSRVFLLNALILPGTGHIYAGRNISGGIYLISFVAAMIFFLRTFVIDALLYFQSVNDFANIVEFLIYLAGDVMFLFPLAVSVLIWIITIADSVRVNRGINGV